MNGLSIALLGFIALLALRGFTNGFVREMVSFCAIAVATPIAAVLYDDLAPALEPLVHDLRRANFISFIVIWAGVVILGQTISQPLRSFVRRLDLSQMDRLAGLAFGLAKATIVCQVLLLVLTVYPNKKIQREIEASPVAVRLLSYAPALLAILPAEYEDKADQFLDPAGSVNGKLNRGGF